MLMEETVAIISSFLQNVLNYLSGITFPGTYMSVFGVLGIFALLSALIAIIRWYFGLATSSLGSSSGGNNGNIKVSEERSKDTK